MFTTQGGCTVSPPHSRLANEIRFSAPRHVSSFFVGTLTTTRSTTHPPRHPPAQDRYGQHPAPCTPQSGGLSGRLANESPPTQVAQEGLRLAKRPTFESDSEDVVGMVSVSCRSLAVRLRVLDSLGSVLSEQ